MQNVNHAVANLRALTGLDDLEFNANGHLELVFGEAVSVDVVRIDDRHIELSTAVKALGHALDADKLAALLAANADPASGAARFALDPRDRAILLCERIDVVPIDDRALEARLLAFVGRARAWNGEAAARLLAELDAARRAAAGTAPDGHEPGFAPDGSASLVIRG